jgi:hypothetical protein
MHRFEIADTAMILIDHQVGTNTWAATDRAPSWRRGARLVHRDLHC